LLALLPSLQKAAPVRTIRQRPKAEDFPWGSNKDTTTPSAANTSPSGPSATPVPKTTKVQPGPLANGNDEGLLSSVEKLIGSTADRFEPVSKPAERFEPVSLLPTTPLAAAIPSLANNRPFDDNVALADAPVALAGPAFEQYRDRPEDDDSESSEDEDEDKEEEVNDSETSHSADNNEDEDGDVNLKDAPEPVKEPAVQQSTA
jgi:hypothetical protein